MTRFRLLGALTVVGLVACGGGGGDPDSGDSDFAASAAPLSYVGQSVMATLTKTKNLAPLQHTTWELTSGNRLDADWLLPTFGQDFWGDKLTSLPTDTACADGEAGCDADFHMRTCDDTCPSGSCVAFAPTVTADGQDAKKMCVGFMDWFEQAYYDAIVGAEHFVDITSLWLPADRFVPAIRNALLRVAARGTPLTVRILSGDASDVGPMAYKSTSEALAALTKGLPAAAPLKIYVAEHSAALLSWNHSKIIAADGKFALVGGHNMHTADYQEKDPVSDLSMRLTGPAAAAAHRYANQVWDVACKRGSLHGFGLETFPASLPCPAHIEPQAVPAENGDATVIAAGRLGAVPDNASDAALLAMVDAAKSTVVMSQEDILGGRIPKTNLSVAPPPKDLLDRLGKAMGRGVDVYLVISNVDGGLFTTSYSHGWTAAETAQQMADHMKSKPELFPQGTDIVDLLCKKMHVTGIRVADTDRWPDGKVFSNHAKFLMIDTQAFYIGSQNLYVSDLAEFGFIVDSAAAAKVARDAFWDPLWSFSQRDAASGSEAQQCAVTR
jgi:phosphatidylserine/phosphatidylglycerophosphate/cardiolipin synthase-like enzyme